MQIKFKRLSPDAKLPTKAHSTDIGFDLYCVDERVVLSPGIPTKISTGIACGFPKGIAGLILGRSSLGKDGIVVLGGVIDQGYTGELIVCLANITGTLYDAQNCPTQKSIVLKRGAKIAQLVLIPSYEVNIIEVDSLEETDRGSKGFGSSGS